MAHRTTARPSCCSLRHSAPAISPRRNPAWSGQRTCTPRWRSPPRRRCAPPTGRCRRRTTRSGMTWLTAGRWHRDPGRVRGCHLGRRISPHPDRPWQMATPDRLVDEVWFEPDNSPALIREERRLLATLECKIDGGSDGWGEDGSDEIPVHYRCQVLWQMDVMDVTTGYVACLLWHRRQVRVYELTMDDDALRDLALMRMGAERFRRYV